MLTRFEVQGFKSLVDVAVDLGAVNVFIGSNGSGKSNLLEAIGFLGAVGSSGPEPESFRYRGLRLGPPTSYLSAFKDHPAKSIGFRADGSEIAYSATVSARLNRPLAWSIDAETVSFCGELIAEHKGEDVRFNGLDPFMMVATSSSPTWSIKSVTLNLLNSPTAWINPRSSIGGGHALAHRKHDIFSDSLDDYCIYTPSTPQLRGFLDDILRDPLGLGGSGLGRAIEEMTATDPERFGPFEIDDVIDLIEWADHIGTDAPTNGTALEAPIRLRIGDRYLGNDHKAISAVESSEGALYVLFLLALVGHERSPKMFAVDNFDQALHPRLARELTKMVCDQIIADGTRQMFATTHNPLVLDGLNLLDDRIRLFAVDRDASGATQVRRVVVTKELIDQSNAGLSLSRLWTMGRFGGVPHNI